LTNSAVYFQLITAKEMNMNGNKSPIQSLHGPHTICLDSYASELAIINQWIWARTKIQLSVLDNKKCTVWSVCLVFLPVLCLCLFSICVCFVSVCPVRLSVWFLFLSSLSSCLVVLYVFLSVCLVFSDLSVYLSVCFLFLSVCLSLWCVCLSGLS